MFDVENVFTYHTPNSEQVERMKTIRDKAKELAMFIKANSKETPEQTLALRNLEMCSMYANANIVRNE